MSRTLRDLVQHARGALEQAGIPGAAGDALLLAAQAAGVPRDRAVIAMREAVPGEAWQTLEALLGERCARKPLSHLLGYRDFFNHRFKITPQVLDPRPETEILVLAALAVPFRHVLDLGTGSGAILISLLDARPAAQGLGSDLSQDALQVARDNAAQIGVASRATFRRADWFDGITGRFDLIVSNPPYIAAAEMAGLAPELAHEPRMALTDEQDGLSAYRRIAGGAQDHLAPGGRLIVEIGPTQAAQVRELFRVAGLANVHTGCDLDGRDRIVLGEMPLG